MYGGQGGIRPALRGRPPRGSGLPPAAHSLPLPFESPPSIPKEKPPPQAGTSLLADRVGFDLRCGGGRVAALERPRRSIHYRSRSNPLQVFQKRSPRHKAGASLLADRVGFPACGRPGLGSDSPPGCHSLPRPSNPTLFYANSPTREGGTICMADRVGFEPTSLLRDYLISSQGRYDHFDTCPGALPLYPIPTKKSSPAFPVCSYIFCN